MNPTDLLLRPVAAADLPALERLAAASVDAINSLPKDPAKLRLRIERSLDAFATEDDASGEETYLFVLEDAGRVVGCSGIAASAGFHDRFYSYRNEFVVHASPGLGVTQRMHTLHLCHDLTGATLLTSFYIEPGYEQTVAPQLLSRARLLFIRRHAERFNARIAAENPGLSDVGGACPFWDAVGRRFFAMDYAQAEAVSGGRSKSFIADLMPHAPVYVALLPEDAQWAIGQLHPVGELPFSILQAEGFEADTYVDIFDGGPTVVGTLEGLHSVRAVTALRVGTETPQAEAAGAGADWHIVCAPGRADFRASLALLDTAAPALPSGHELVRRWQLTYDQEIDISPLRLAGDRRKRGTAA